MFFILFNHFPIHTNITKAINHCCRAGYPSAPLCLASTFSTCAAGGLQASSASKEGSSSIAGRRSICWCFYLLPGNFSDEVRHSADRTQLPPNKLSVDCAGWDEAPLAKVQAGAMAVAAQRPQHLSPIKTLPCHDEMKLPIKTLPARNSSQKLCPEFVESKQINQ